MKIKTLSVFGTRPEAIKMAPLIHCLQGDDRFDNHVMVTGQHRDLLDSALLRLDLHPTINLQVMNEDLNLNQLVATMLQGIDDALRVIQPDCVLVHGDTATAMATAITTYHYKIPVVHIEAGLRTDDLYSPWPEEGNRRLIAAIASLHCAPTSNARLNLLHEGIVDSNIVMCGNTVVDALFAMMHRLDHDVRLQHELQQQFAYLLPSRPLILVTGHRRESFGEGFARICSALRCIAECWPEVGVVYPVHLNPQVLAPVRALLGDINTVYLLEPLDYAAFVYLMRRAAFILTDSGGIQEEASSLGKPLLIMREKTERREALQAGVAHLVGTQIESIVRHSQTILDALGRGESLTYTSSTNPFGDGQAASRIRDALVARFDSIKTMVLP